MAKVIVAEKIAESGVEVLRQEHEVDLRFGVKQAELLEIIGDYDALIVRSVIKVNEELLSRARNLKVVGRAGNGIDNIQVPACTKRGILVVNTPESNTISAAEHTIALLLSSIRSIPRSTAQLKGGGWDRTPFKGVELYGKTIGIVGLGRIGSMVATRLAAFGTRVIAYDPYISDERFRRFGVEKMSVLNELVRRADVITVHTPRTEETMGMIGEEQFRVAKKGVIVINCARGGIVNEAALIKAMNQGTVAYAGLDVFEQEPSPGNPIFQLEKIAVSPHCGADTDEAQARVGITIAAQVNSALRGEIVPNAVNLPTLREDELGTLVSFLELAEKMGKVYFQLEKEPVERLEFTYSGRVARLDTEMITVSFLKGLLEPVLGEQVNYVNAPILARDRGIKQMVSKEIEDGIRNSEFSTLIEVKVFSSRGGFELAGTLSTRSEPRLVVVKGYETDTNPTGVIIYIENLDQPGVVGRLTTILEQARINIAMMEVTRRERGDKALMAISVESDEEIRDEVVSRLRDAEGVLGARVVRF